MRVLLTLLLCTSAYGLTADEIMDKVYENKNNYNTLKMDIHMTIRDKEGRERHRYLNLLEKDYVTERKSLIKFYLPANLKGVALLTHWYNLDGC